jgi:hypothetical protein
MHEGLRRHWLVLLPRLLLGLAMMAAPIAIVGVLGCSKSEVDASKHQQAAKQLVLANVEQRGKDTYADVQVRPEWIAERRTIPVMVPLGRTIKVTLNPVMEEGSFLRFKGYAPDGGGDLLLRVCILK